MGGIGIGIGLRSECGGGLDIWVWGGGVRLRCRSGLLGCWLHPLDAARDRMVLACLVEMMFVSFA